MTDDSTHHELFGSLFTSSEREWIEKYGGALEELTTGSRAPKTPAQAMFVRIARGEAPPSTRAEKLWMRYLLAREVDQLREVLAKQDSLLESISNMQRAVLIEELGAEFLVRSDHPALLRVCADHYLRDDPTDPQRAFPLALRASELGDGQGACIVGMLYEYGVGVAEDRRKAKEFYDLAAQRGVESARAKLPARPPLPPGKYDHLRWAIPSDNSSRSDDDWGASDDFDAATWEEIMGGPDDSYFEHDP